MISLQSLSSVPRVGTSRRLFAAWSSPLAFQTPHYHGNGTETIQGRRKPGRNAVTPRIGRTANRQRVLIVEDDADFRGFLEAMLEGYPQIEVAIAKDGRRACDMVRQWLPDVVLLDLGLPGMDGFSVSRRIKTDPRLRRTRIIGITGLSGTDLCDRLRAAGAEACLRKPLDPRQLVELLGLSPDKNDGPKR
ncbi:MAG: response regulator [Gammaproteobacteria bacterium]|nr:MAG: response regulator [Gammaproteobacteria bacterium]